MSPSLPPPPEPAAQREASPWAAEALGAARLALQVISVTVALVAASGGCHPPGERTVPDELVGTWKTSAPKYKGRDLQFTKGTIAFGTGIVSPDVYPITRVEEVREGQGILYTVSYTDDPDGHQSTFAFYYEPGKNAAIRFKRQPQIAWTKERR